MENAHSPSQLTVDDATPTTPPLCVHQAAIPMRRPWVWLAVLMVGLLMAVAAFSPPINPPQCPDYAARMPDGSVCIIGANIGASLILLAGVLVMFVGAVGSSISLVVGWWEGRRRNGGCS